MAFPGVCTNGSPAQTVKWTGMRIKGTRRATQAGSLKVTFNTLGSFFLTSPIKGECDSHWFRVNVV